MNATSTASLTEGLTIANRFRLLRPLRKGGMGSVWIATHTTLGTEVAIKFVEIRGESHDALRRFEREANVVARLRSPHVVQILDYGVDESDRPYLAMELLQGESLKDRLDRTRTLPLEEVTTVLIQTCRALHRAHKAGIVHRDIKPANLFLSEEDDSLHVKVLDFGVAKANAIVPGPSDAQKTETGAIVGTPAYMSPEQVLASEEIDGRSDLFSLGVLAWRMLVGVNPHEREGKSLGFGELLIQIATKPVPPPSQFVEGISPEVDAWFARALAIEAKNRFANAKEMAEGLATATHRTFAQAGTGAYAAMSADVSGNIAAAREAFHDSDDEVSAPAEVEALRIGGTNSGARKIASLSNADASGATGPGTRQQKKGAPIVWIGGAVALVAVALWFVLGRAHPPTPVPAPPIATETAASTPPVADDHAGLAAPAAPSPDVTAAQASPPPAAAPPPPRGRRRARARLWTWEPEPAPDPQDRTERCPEEARFLDHVAR